MKAQSARPSKVVSGRVRVPPPKNSPVPTRHASGTPIRPGFIRALLNEQKAFEQLSDKMDKLREVLGDASEAGAPAPPWPPEGQKT